MPSSTPFLIQYFIDDPPQENISLCHTIQSIRAKPKETLKNNLMSKWHLIENQPLLKEIYQDPPIISYKRGNL